MRGKCGVVLIAVGGIAPGIANAGVVFDNISSYEAGSQNIGVSATSSLPNTFMGMGVNLAPGTTDITGFDIFPVNVSGTNFNALKITIYIWDTVNTSGTVNATTPAFSNLLGTYTATSTGTFTTGFFYNFEGSPVGVNPGLTITPLALADTQIGISFNYQGSTDGGLTYNSVNSLTSLIMTGGNAATNPVTVGSAVFSGYYRNAGTPTETDGNFTSSLRTLGGLFNESLGVRIYSSVPAPGGLAILGLGLLGGARRRCRKA
jgi:MYXO-CTERM domain-containing protein